MKSIIKLIILCALSSTIYSYAMDDNIKRKREDDSQEVIIQKKQKKDNYITLVDKDNESLPVLESILRYSQTLSDLLQDARQEQPDELFTELSCFSLNISITQLQPIIELLNYMHHAMNEKGYTEKTLALAMHYPIQEDLVRWLDCFKKIKWSTKIFEELVNLLDINLLSHLLDLCIEEKKSGLPFILDQTDVRAHIMHHIMPDCVPLFEKIKKKLQPMNVSCKRENIILHY